MPALLTCLLKKQNHTGNMDLFFYHNLKFVVLFCQSFSDSFFLYESVLLDIWFVVHKIVLALVAIMSRGRDYVP